MASFESMRSAEKCDACGPVRGLWIWPLWIIGLISALYLFWIASLWLYLAVGFGVSAPDVSRLEYIWYVAFNAMPLICYVTIGIIGLRLLHSKRLWIVGLLVVLVESGLAIYAYTNPTAIPIFSGLLL